ncbi:hypothetical protein MKW98_000331 [Papaver atlanticum]|uniref:Uncharacterized protein n=1 Tax=Papaver atlanticum TaxID=357466 RepID=A0AAD4S4Z9_9MAGN|nr:hypothetical protein MKW98_000331 [Papaver atlanticum]
MQQIASECITGKRGTCFDTGNEFLSSTDMDGGEFCIFDRSVIVSNGILHSKFSCQESSTDEMEIGNFDTVNFASPGECLGAALVRILVVVTRTSPDRHIEDTWTQVCSHFVPSCTQAFCVFLNLVTTFCTIWVVLLPRFYF